MTQEEKAIKVAGNVFGDVVLLISQLLCWVRWSRALSPSVIPPLLCHAWNAIYAVFIHNNFCFMVWCFMRIFTGTKKWLWSLGFNMSLTSYMHVIRASISLCSILSWSSSVSPYIHMFLAFHHARPKSQIFRTKSELHFWSYSPVVMYLSVTTV